MPVIENPAAYLVLTRVPSGNKLSSACKHIPRRFRHTRSKSVDSSCKTLAKHLPLIKDAVEHITSASHKNAGKSTQTRIHTLLTGHTLSDCCPDIPCHDT